MGDPYQLPPVHDRESKALSPLYFEGIGLSVVTVNLTTVHRQAKGSGIQVVASELRHELESGKLTTMGFPTSSEVEDSTSAKMIERLTSGCSSSVGITRSNALALKYNQAIRSLRWRTEDPTPVPGDRLQVVRNSKIGLLNGDLVEVLAVHNRESRTIYLKGEKPVELNFLGLTIKQEGSKQHPESEDIEMKVQILENMLDSSESGLSYTLVQAF